MGHGLDLSSASFCFCQLLHPSMSEAYCRCLYALRGRLVKRSTVHLQFAGMCRYVVIHALLQSLLLTMEAYRCRDQIYPAVKNYPPLPLLYRLYYPLCVSRRIATWQIVYLSNKDPCPKISIHKSEIKDSDGNSQVSASTKWLALAEPTCNW